jgi:predicted transcriptional regulator of viral defense system
MSRDPRDNERALYRVAAGQGGHFTAAQAIEAGYAYSQQHFHVARGNWLRVDRGLFRLRDFPAGEREDLIRWSLWSRDRRGVPQAVVSHETALTEHELSDVMPARIDLTVPKGFRKRVPPGCVVHKAMLGPEDVESRTGYSVTTPLRTLVDVSASALSQEHLDRAVKEALERGLVPGHLLDSAAADPEARGRLERALATAREGLAA